MEPAGTAEHSESQPLPGLQGSWPLQCAFHPGNREWRFQKLKSRVCLLRLLREAQRRISFRSCQNKLWIFRAFLRGRQWSCYRTRRYKGPCPVAWTMLPNHSNPSVPDSFDRPPSCPTQRPGSLFRDQSMQWRLSRREPAWLLDSRWLAKLYRDSEWT